MNRAKVCAFAVALVLQLLANGERGALRAQAPAPDALTFFKNYFITGDYVVGGIGLRGAGVNGVATGTISMSGVPANADIVAAYLYWEAMEVTAEPSASAGKFRGFDIVGKSIDGGGVPSCRGSGGGSGTTGGASILRVYRADVLRYLPVPVDAKNTPIGKQLVNDADLAAFGFAPHTVSLPDSGSGGSQSPSTGNQAELLEGASLVVVYRDPAMPLKAVVIYDGAYTANQDHPVMNQTIQGFYQVSTANVAAKMTQLVGDGDKNFKETLTVDGVVPPGVAATNAFVGAQGFAWDNLTFDVSAIVAQASRTAPVTTRVEPVLSSIDCLSWSAIVFSTTVQDTDSDGLLDIWEDQSGLVDPRGQPLPDLHAMGATSRARDMFVEIGFMSTSGYTTPAQGVVPAHSHLPSIEAINLFGDALKNAPLVNPDGSTGVRAHVDAGSNLQTNPPNPYVIPFTSGAGNLARGGEEIPETACVPTATTTCQFPDYPGTVGWKSGYQALRDEPLNGVSDDACEAAEQTGLTCLRRFDRNRRDMFRYALFAHGIGVPRSDVDNPATPYDERTTPAKNSGIADSPGGDILVTLGFWDGFVGTPFIQGSTLAHEFGHTAGLRHGGAFLQPNCKPNYLSVMNYLFQVQGLIPQRAGGAALPPVVDFSRQVLPALNENALVEANGLGTMAYRTAWFAPAASSFIAKSLGTTPVTRHCDGSPVTDGAQVVRVDGTSVTPPIDWNADGVTDSGAIAQDVNFSGGALTTLDAGTNDFLIMDFRQTGSRRNVGGLSLDMGRGDLGRGDLGRGDLGRGDLGRGDLGRGDLGRGDLGRGDLGVAPPDAPRGDLDFDVAVNYANAPSTLTAAVVSKTVKLDWTAPHVNDVNVYFVYRVIGSTVTPANFAARVLVGQPAAPTTTFTDTATRNNVTYTYFVQAQFVDGTRSGISNYATVTR